MAALAIPPLASAVDWLLMALGATATAGGAVVVSDKIRRRQQAVSEAGTSDVAKTASSTGTKSCDKCPSDGGRLVRRNWNMSTAAREYQAKVTAFEPGTEWNFGGIDFDGFGSADCTLKEAKSRYDQFLTGGEDAELQPKRWFKAFEKKMLPQAAAQAAVARAAPPSRLTWFFQGPKTYAYMRRMVMAQAPLVAVYLP